MEKRDLIITLHGFLGKPQDWNFQFPNYHYPNSDFFSPSFFTEGEWSSRKSFTEWGELFLNQCEKWFRDGYNLKLFAYSLGGRLALGPYLRNPQLFAEAHFLSVNPGLTTVYELEQRKISDYNWSRKFLNEPWDFLIKSWNSQSVFFGDHEPERREADFSRELLSLALTQWSLGLQSDYWQQLATLKQSVNWWGGQKDSKYRDIAERLGRENANIKVGQIPNCGHRVLFSKNFLVDSY